MEIKMELYDISKNINNIDKEKMIKESITVVKQILSNLTTERTCIIYSSYLYEELRKRKVIARIINTKDLDLSYEHQFILVSNNLEEKTYFLVDLTFNQFLKSDKITMFKDLIENGYQEINNDLWYFYVNEITKNKESNVYSLDQAFNKQIKENNYNIK